MKILTLASFILLSISSTSVAQTQSDDCHVYVMDVAEARRAFDNFRASGNAETDVRGMSTGITIVGRFVTTIGEEELTTRSYPFPIARGGLIITASVYYTDESMAAESMLIGIVVSNNAQENAIFSANNAVAEVSLNEHLDTVRVKKFVTVRGRSFLVGVECHCLENREPRR